MTASIYDVSVARADGSETTLADYAGKVLMIVNVASKCGFTEQYRGLEELYRCYRCQGFVILGSPLMISAAKSRALTPLYRTSVV